MTQIGVLDGIHITDIAPALLQDVLDGVHRRQPRHRKDDEEHAEDHENAIEDAPDKVGDHAVSSRRSLPLSFA